MEGKRRSSAVRVAERKDAFPGSLAVVMLLLERVDPLPHSEVGLACWNQIAK